MDKKELKELIGLKNLSVIEAMEKINQNSNGILILVDENNRLVGTLTDGDVRRFLLAGGETQEPVYKVANHHPRYAFDQTEAAELYHEKSFVAIPIVDKEQKVIDIYIRKHHKHNIASLGLNVVINAGGRGTRLDPYTRIFPKPLIPVGDLPIVEHIMQEFMKFGCHQFHMIVNYKKQLIKAYFSENENNYDVKWYDESEPLGTGGGLSLLKGKINETFFFTNCDILLRSDYESILKFHRDNSNMITMVCAYKNITIPYGVVDIGKNGKIDGMREKPQISFLTNTGMYLVEPEVIDEIKDEVPVGFPDIIEEQRRKGKNVAVYPVSDNEWMDMGQFTQLEKMRKRLYGEEMN